MYNPLEDSPWVDVRPQKQQLSLSLLVMLAFASAFHVRLLLLVHFPGAVNVLHVAIIPLVCGCVLWKTRIRDRVQLRLCYQLLLMLLIFLGVNFLSAIVNHGGLVNVGLNFLFFAQHFLILLAILALRSDRTMILRLRAFLIGSSFLNLACAYGQRYIWQLHLRSGLADNIKGVFIDGGAGHVVGASVSLTFGMYYFHVAKHQPLWLRGLLALLCFWHMVIADAKQVLLVFGVSALLWFFSQIKDPLNLLKYVVGSSFLAAAFWWCMVNVPAFDAFNTWLRSDIYGPDGEATALKTVTFRIVSEYFQSPFHGLVGLGPGHTVGRLGGWMLGKYQGWLQPFGATVHDASREVWAAVGASWLGDQSSMFSPLFGWAGLWGDLGWLGLISFGGIWWVVWQHIAITPLARFFLINPLVFGLVFSQMEEPGYMAYLSVIFALLWHEDYFQRQRGEPIAQLSKTPPRTLNQWIRSLFLLP